MTEQEWWNRAGIIANELGTSLDSNEVMNAADNTCEKDGNFIYPIYTEESLHIFACGLESILKGE